MWKKINDILDLIKESYAWMAEKSVMQKF